MSVHEDMQELGESVGLDMEENLYTGKEKEFMTFNFVMINDSDFADDIAKFEEDSIQIHYFVPLAKNYISTRKKIKKWLKSKEYDVSIGAVLLEQETLLRHIVFEATKKEEILNE